MKVLLVDDDPDLVILASFALEKLGGFSVVTSPGGAGAVDLAVRERPDVILLDLLLPDVDGDVLFRRFRDRPELAKTPIIFLTGSETTDEHQRLLELGACGVLVKPFDPETLAVRVERLLRRR